MNIKMFLTVTLLGVSLYLGGSSVIYAESAENVTENFEDSFSDCDLEPEMEEDETGFYGGTAVLGLQAVRGLVAPAMDAIKRTALGRTAGAIPAVGNAVNAVTELILAGALLVKNCLGAMAVVVLLLAGAGPVIHYGLLSLSFRFLGAVAQPVSDKRIVGCLGTMGEGCALLLRIMLTAEILCVLTFIVLMASVGG